MSADACAVPTPTPARQLSCRRSARRSRPVVGARRRGGAGARRQQQDAVDDQEDRRGAGEANRLRSGCSSSRPRIPAGIVPTTSSQPSFASASSGRSRGRGGSARCPARSAPSPRQKKKSSTSAVARCVATRKVEEVVVVLVDVPAEQPRQDRRCARGSRSERAPRPLQQPEDDRLEVRDQRCTRLRLLGVAGRRPGLEPGEGEAAEPHDQRGDAVLDVMVVEPASWPGKNPGSDPAGSTQ